ncbi:peptidylprolyl isomerase, partial [Paenibacillus sepulcri]|nr:peptidylprolyl isomerase [Paenibacillus sepulcri]
ETDGAQDESLTPVPVGAGPSAPEAGRRGNSSKPWMFIAIGLALLLVVALIKPPFGSASGSDEVVATVNDVKITQDNLFDKMISLGGKSTLDQMIQEELVKQEADKAGITATEADIDSEVKLWEGRFPTADDFNAWLQQNGMTEADFRKEMPTQLRIRKLLEPKATVTDDQIKQYFDQNKASFDTPEQVRVSHILVATKAEAEAILKELQGGADFAKLASEKSIDTGSKDNGGDLNFFPRGVMDKPFEDAAFALKTKDELSPIVQGANGFHIIKFTDRKAAHTATLDEEKAKIKDQLLAQQVSELSSSWLQDIKAKAKITNTLEEPAAADAPADPNAPPADPNAPPADPAAETPAG